MITPCVNVCAVENGVCKGCGRTLEEIAQWIYFSDTERQEVMERLEHEEHLRDQRRFS